MNKETENAGTRGRAGNKAGGPTKDPIDDRNDPNNDPDSDQARDQAGDRVRRAVRLGGSAGRNLLPLPGLAAIALYLMVLAGVIILGVVSGGHYPPVFLIFSVLFIASSAGMLMLFRWAWSLALAAVMMLTGYNLWVFTREHQAAALVQGLLNLVFFLYLVRSEVREVLR